jgi:protein SCO1
MKSYQFSFRIVFFTLILGVFISSCGMVPPSFKGQVLNPVKPAPEIKMVDAKGQPFQLSSYRGKIAVLFFGYVNCPDECPATMARLKLALAQMGNEAGNIQVVLVSTDPVRDTPQTMQDFLNKFNVAFIGIPGSPEELAKIWKDYGVIVLDGGETHTSEIFVIDAGGNLRLILDAESDPEALTTDFKTLLAQK